MVNGYDGYSFCTCDVQEPPLQLPARLYLGKPAVALLLGYSGSLFQQDLSGELRQ